MDKTKLFQMTDHQFYTTLGIFCVCFVIWFFLVLWEDRKP